MKFRATLMVTLFLIGGQCAAAPDIDFQVPEEKQPRTKAADDIVVDLDLSSGVECVPAALAFEAEHYKKKLVSVNEGDTVRVISKNCMLTAGEYFAAKRNMLGKDQGIDLTSHGVSAGGTLSLDRYTAEHCRNLYLPKNTTMMHDASEIPTFKLSGQLHIAGKYLVTGKAKSCTISATQVRVEPSGFVGSPTGHDPIEVLFEAPEGVDLAYENKIPAGQREIVYSKGKDGARQNEAVINSDYKLQKVQRMLIQTRDEYIPADGEQQSAIEGGVEQQERESCQKRKK